MRRQSVILVTDFEWGEWDWYSRCGEGSWTSEKQGASLKICYAVFESWAVGSILGYDVS